MTGFDQEAFYRGLDLQFKTGNAATIEKYLYEQLELAKESGDRAGGIAVNNELGGILRAQGKIDEALRIYQEILSTMIDVGLQDTVHYATALLNTGDVYLANGQYEAAERYFDEAAGLYTRLGLSQAYPMAAVYNNRSVVARERGDYKTACGLLNQALVIIQNIPEAAAEVATTLVNMGQLELMRGELDSAKNYLEDALKRYNALPGERDVHQGQAYQALAQVYYHMGDYPAALAECDRAQSAIARDFGTEGQAYRELEALRSRLSDLIGGAQ